MTREFSLEVGKHNCIATFQNNLDQIAVVKKSMSQFRLQHDIVVALVINTQDAFGQILYDGLAPYNDWIHIQHLNSHQYVFGYIAIQKLQILIEQIDPEAAEKLQNICQWSVVIIDHEVAEVFAC